MTQQNFAPKRKMNALSEYKLRLVGKPVAGSNRAPNLSVVVVKNQPHIVVRTNVEGDKNYGKIEAKLDTPTFFALMEKIKDVANGENGRRFTLENSGHPFTNGQRSKEPKLDTKIIIGKTAEGVVWLAVTSWEQSRPIIQFSFTPSQYHNWLNSDGTPMGDAEASRLGALGYAEVMSELVPQILYHEYVEPEQRQDNNQGGGGGYNRGGGGGGNWNNNQGGGGQQQQRRPQADDIPDYGSGAAAGGGGFDDGLPM